MPAPAVIAAIMAAASIAQGVAAKKAHERQAEEIEEQQKGIPPGLEEARSMLEMMSHQGIPGIESIIADIEAQLPEGITQMKELSASPSSLLGAASDMQSRVSQSVRDLLVRDAIAQRENKAKLASFLAGPYAGAEADIQDFNIQKQLMAAQERFAGSSELWQGIGGAAKAGIGGYSQGVMLETLSKNPSFAQYLANLSSPQNYPPNFGGYGEQPVQFGLPYSSGNPQYDYLRMLLSQ